MYSVAQHHKLSDLVDIVNKAVSEGWKPIGGISVASLHSQDMVYVQAMWKDM